MVAAACGAASVDEVIVVDNNSRDRTGDAARRAGARVVLERTPGKGEAMRTGVRSTDAEVVVFLDADLIGLTSAHVEELVDAVRSGSAAMSCGLFDRGPLLNPVFLDALPILTGQRAMRRELFESLHATELRGWRVEAALNSLVDQQALPVHAFVCEGLWHRTKEEKYKSPAAGFAAKQAMLVTAVWGYVFFWLRRRVLSRVRPISRPRPRRQRERTAA